MDTGSSDGSSGVLRSGLPSGATVLDAPGAFFGTAVAAAVHSTHEAANEAQSSWYWLLHDDSAPEPDALKHLLDAVEKAPSVTVAGCKQVEANRPDRLVDGGLTMTRSGRRFNRVAPDEVDQGQYDHTSDSLGVNSAGLLIRADVYATLGGFDPALPGVGDDVDLGRRAWLAGHRVVVVPEARIRHHNDEVEAVSGPRVTERAAAYSRLKFASGLALPFLAVWMLIAGLGRAVGRLIGKDPAGAIVDLGAGATGLLRPRQLAAGRRRLSGAQRVPRAVVRPLLAKPSVVRDRRRTLREERAVFSAGPGAAALRQEASGGDDSFDTIDTGSRTAGSAAGGLLAVILAAGLSLLGLYRFFGAGAVTGGSLIPPGQSVADLWRAATSGWQELGTGAAAPPDPFDFLLWLSGVLSFGHPQQAGVALYVLAMPLAALSTWLLLGALTRSAGFRFLGALAWALAPTLQVALAQGRPGAVVVHVVLPVLVLALIRAVGAARHSPESAAGSRVPGRGGVPSWAAAASASLLALLVVAAEPILVLPLVLFCAVGGAVARRARGLWWVPLPSLVLTLPLLLRAISEPRVLLGQPGLPVVSDPAPLWQLLLGWPVAFDANTSAPGLAFLGDGPLALLVAAAVAVPLALFAIPALVRAGNGTTTARILVFTGLLGLGAALFLGRLDAAVSGTELVHPFLGSWVSLFLVGVLAAAAVQREALLGRRGVTAKPLARVAAGVLSTLTVVGLVAAGTLWVVPRIAQNASQQDSLATAQLAEPSNGQVLPATAADRGTGRYAERTLQLHVQGDGQIQATLASGDGVRLEDLSAPVAAGRLNGQVFVPESTGRAPESPGESALRTVVATLASGEQIDARQELGLLAVSHVVLSAGDAGSDVLAKHLDSVPGLSPVGRGTGDQSWIWGVQAVDSAAKVAADAGSPTARVRVLGQDGSVLELLASEGPNVKDVALPSGPAGRLLVLSASADAGWVATVNGAKLSPVSHEWAQAFALPESGGTLKLRYSEPWNAAWLGGLALALLIALLSIIPLPRSWRADARAARVYRPTAGRRHGASDEQDAAEGADGKKGGQAA